MIHHVLDRPLHVSWVVATASVGVVGGTIAAANASGFASIAWVMTGIALCMVAARAAKVWLIAVAVFGGGLIGLWRGSVTQVELRQFAEYTGSDAVISGTVSEDVDTDKSGQFVLRIKDIEIGGRAVPGTVWATTPSAIGVQRSDRVTLSGRLVKGFGSFAASMYRSSILKVERPMPGDVALMVRNRFAEGVHLAVSETEASLGLGYVVGQRRGLPEDLDAALRTAGLTHIVVASGYNLTILVRLARRLFERVSKYLSLMVSGAMIMGFITITGMSPSMSRAGLVAGLSLLAWYYGRRFHPLVLLPFAMAITVLIQPSYAWGDLGWQLSFAAFGGVMVLAPLIQAYFFGDMPEKVLRRIFIETIAATIATLPILMVSFGQVSVIAPIANMLVLPLVPLAMLLTFVAGVGGLLIPVAASILGSPAQLVLNYMTTTAQSLGGISWAVQEVSIPTYGAVMAYTFIVCGCVYMQRASGYSLRRSSLVE